MRRHFTPEFLEEARHRLGGGLVDIVGETVPLKRAGHLYEACCPFHNEKTPSFKVLDGQSGWHFCCFGCGAQGDVFAWLQRKGGLGFQEAVVYVAERVGMELPPVSPEQQQRHDRQQRLLTIVSQTGRFFTRSLQEERGAAALAYLTGRGIAVDQIEHFQLGYAPGDVVLWRKVIDHLTDRGFSPEEMVASGVYRRDDATGRLRPFFVNKLIVPIRDIQGRPVAFAGRKMGDGEGPKYINSPDCELFSKRQVVYNADRAAVQAADGDRQVKLVEGYFDVMAMEKAGLGPVVSCMGTSATVEQMETIWKLNRRGRNEPVLCFDGDAAGHDAAQKAAERFLPLITPTRSVRFAMLSGAHDPASLLERPDGRDVLEREIERAISGPMVLYRREASLLPKTPSPEDIAAFHSALDSKIIRQIRDPSLRNAYKDEFWRLRRERNGLKPATQKPDVPTVPRSLSEPALLAALIHHAELFFEFGEDVGGMAMSTPEMDDCRDLIIAWMLNSTDEVELRLQAEAMVEQCEAIRDFVLTDAVYAAAPFVKPDASLDEVRAGIRSILVDMQVGCVKREVARLMGLINGSDDDGRIMAQVSALLENLRASGS